MRTRALAVIDTTIVCMVRTRANVRTKSVPVPPCKLHTQRTSDVFVRTGGSDARTLARDHELAMRASSKLFHYRAAERLRCICVSVACVCVREREHEQA